MVLAPGLGSTSTCWPSFAVSPSAMTRTKASGAPPGCPAPTWGSGWVAPAAGGGPPDESNGAASAAVTTVRRPIAFRDICFVPSLSAGRTLLRVTADS